MVTPLEKLNCFQPTVPACDCDILAKVIPSLNRLICLTNDYKIQKVKVRSCGLGENVENREDQ